MLVVVFCHANFELFSGGFIGVDVFFVISGFLVTKILFEEINFTNGLLDLSRFYCRRFRRLLPNASVTMLFVVCAGYILTPRTTYLAWSSSVKYNCFFLGNFYVYNGNIGYFDQDNGPLPLLHFWSLAVEEQFYLIFPLIVYVCVDRHRVFFGVVCMLGVCSLWLWLFYPNTMFNYYMLPSRAWELLAGAILCRFTYIKSGSNIAEQSTYMYMLYYVGLLAILVPVYVYDSNTFADTPGVAIIPVLGTLILLYISVMLPSTSTRGQESPVYLRLLSNHFLVHLGDMSYSIYLWHQPVLVIFPYLSKRVNFFSMFLFINNFTTLLPLFISFLLAVIFYYCWENPWRNAKLSNLSSFILAITCLATPFATTIFVDNTLVVAVIDPDMDSSKYNNESNIEKCFRRNVTLLQDDTVYDKYLLYRSSEHYFSNNNYTRFLFQSTLPCITLPKQTILSPPLVMDTTNVKQRFADYFDVPKEKKWDINDLYDVANVDVAVDSITKLNMSYLHQNYDCIIAYGDSVYTFLLII